jgi:geranylgeranyl pyrophosphate synthase
LLVAAGSVDYARRLAHRLISGARRHLRLLPVSRYRDLLETWAEYVVRRDL